MYALLRFTHSTCARFLWKANAHGTTHAPGRISTCRVCRTINTEHPINTFAFHLGQLGGQQRGDDADQQRCGDGAQCGRAVRAAALLRTRLGELIAQRRPEVGQRQGLSLSIVLLHNEERETDVMNYSKTIIAPISASLTLRNVIVGTDVSAGFRAAVSSPFFCSRLLPSVLLAHASMFSQLRSSRSRAHFFDGYTESAKLLPARIRQKT